ncbi:CoA-binding protein [Rhodohalobacter sulfatireducens]|uniref:CoA-binding protein n=1 Tax=Rhodohalobacter sulfatireducens TaxID=2911366 RepID=A0ABS9KHN9_9BACT|nr:CoA-binding protein [Rhodohalobacter sulfatireducens]MCG2590374.1 CoA-binding protein [Rhodohalobacter sulfatireducens]MDR9366414.1 CoA-binding protein [Balneolaceae bacterium]MDR9410019.1 CoA-binding protein [Balneolaceae bacterium]
MKNTFTNWYDKKMRSDHALSEETDRIQQLLTKIETVAIVGISRNRHKDSRYVGRYLQNAGYKVIPVNPNADEILGEPTYPDLRSIPGKVDVVNVFLPPEWIPEVVDQSIQLQPNVIWLQLGTGNHPDQVKRAQKENITMIQNRCMKVDHQFLIRDHQ